MSNPSLSWAASATPKSEQPERRVDSIAAISAANSAAITCVSTFERSANNHRHTALVAEGEQQ